MKVLITGAKGQVGQELVALCDSDGFSVIATGREELDITQMDSVAQFVRQHNPQLIINAAAYTAVDKAESEAGLAYAINRDAVSNLSEISQQMDIPLFHISTDYVFDGNKPSAYLETDTCNPLGVYGASKLAGEQFVQQLSRHIVLRVAWVFGEFGNNFVKTMLRLGLQRDSLSIVDDQKGGPTWAWDIANVLLTIAQDYRDKGNVDWGTYHFTGSPVVSWFDFATAIFDEAEQQGKVPDKPLLNAIPTEDYPTPAKRPANSALDCSKLFKTFDLSPADWHRGLTRVISQWEKP